MTIATEAGSPLRSPGAYWLLGPDSACVVARRNGVWTEPPIPETSPEVVLEEGRVYVVPPEQELIIHGKRLSLARLPGAIAVELRRALQASEFRLVFQPQWQLPSGSLVGAESLLRWMGGETRNVSTEELIAAAEDCGVIGPIGEWVLRESLAQLDKWRRTAFPLWLSVNLSPVQFHEQDVFGLITEQLKSHGLSPAALKVEITEGVLLHQSVRVKQMLHALHELGVGLILDDFGIGYSSLSNLQQLPVESVKIDASFLSGIGRARNDEAIVRGVIQLAHSTGRTVIAEGVETQQQLDFLREHGCDLAQGFLFAEPLPPEGMDELLAHHTVKARGQGVGGA